MRLALERSPPPSNIPSNARQPTTLDDIVEDAKKYLEATAKKLGRVAPELTSHDKRHTLKFRKGAESIIPKLGAILQKAGIDASGLSVDEMLADLARARSLVIFHQHLVAMTKRVSDEVFTAQASSLRTALDGYAVIQRKARTNGALATELAPIADFFAFRSASSLEEQTPKREATAQAKLRKAQARIDRQVAKATETLARLKPTAPATVDEAPPSAGEHATKA
jgi:hypothetical protein